MRLRLATVMLAAMLVLAAPATLPRPGALDPHRVQLGVELVLAGRELAAGRAQRVLQRASAGAVPDRRRRSPSAPRSTRRSRRRCWRPRATTTSATSPGTARRAAACCCRSNASRRVRRTAATRAAPARSAWPTRATLAFRYYVKLDPAQIAKAMWVESSPDGRLLWTSSGSDLLAYRAADVSRRGPRPAGRRCVRCGGCAERCRRAA